MKTKRSHSMIASSILLALLAAGALASPAGAFTAAIVEFPLPTPGSEPVELALGPDGNLWFTEGQTNRIGRLTPGGTLTEFAIPGPDAEPFGITAGPDGAMWFTEWASSRIGRITMEGMLTRYPLPAGRGPWEITTGPDDNLWFTEWDGNRIGRMEPGGTLTEFALPHADCDPDHIITGPDGALWFTERNCNRIGRITTGGVITEFVVPTANSQPEGLTLGPDGALWFAEHEANKIGRITLAGVFTEFPLPTWNSGPGGIVTGPDGRLWFAEHNANKIGRITPLGAVMEMPVPTPGSHPDHLATGPGGMIWFTEETGNKIGRVDLGSDYADMPVTHWAWPWADRLREDGITTGCSTAPLMYCPEDPVTRAQMAVFLERGIHGAAFQPPPGSGTVFADVPGAYWAVSWIENLLADGITTGCGGGNYCPEDDVTRDQMAVFLLRARHGAAYVPPAVGGDSGFGDVPASHWAAAWIKQLAAEQITTGCGGGNYCPGDAVSRAQMAVFLIRAFDLP